MAKAFTEQERIKIKEKILEAALDLFHDKGTKALSIAELTKRAGIAQGSFYNFWKDKEALIMELIAYRSSQKLNYIEKKFSNSLSDPAKFLTDIIYRYSVDLMVKMQKQPVYEDAFKILEAKNRNEVHRIESLYDDFLTKLIEYWEQNGSIKRADKKGLLNAFSGSFLLCSHYYQFDKEYFNEMLLTFISGIVNKYIEK